MEECKRGTTIVNEGPGYLHCCMKELRIDGMPQTDIAGSLFISGMKRQYKFKSGCSVALPLLWSMIEKRVPVLHCRSCSHTFRVRVDTVAKISDGKPMVGVSNSSPGNSTCCSNHFDFSSHILGLLHIRWTARFSPDFHALC